MKTKQEIRRGQVWLYLFKEGYYPTVILDIAGDGIQICWMSFFGFILGKQWVLKHNFEDRAVSVLGKQVWWFFWKRVPPEAINFTTENETPIAVHQSTTSGVNQVGAVINNVL